MPVPLDQESETLLAELEAAVTTYADREIERLTKRANFLRRLNTRADAFLKSVELEQTRLVISDIDAFLSP